jgi:hypothetical protein
MRAKNLQRRASICAALRPGGLLALALGLLAWAPADAQAADVLLPTFTPRTMSDFGPAERLTEETLKALADGGVAFVPPSEIQKRAGAVADGCADLPDCTTVLWGHFPSASVTVVGTTEYKEGLLDTRVLFYGPDDTAPIESMNENIQERDIPAFAGRVAITARELLELMPPREAGVVALASEPSSPPRRGTVRSDDYSDLDEKPSTGSTKPPTDSADDMERRMSGLPPSLWKQYKASGKSYKDWKEQALVRSGSLIIELYGGAAFGDVKRVYNVQKTFDQVSDGQGEPSFDEIGSYQYEAFVRGSAFETGLSVGYVPLWWLEVGISGGVQLGRRTLTTGWTSYYTAEYGDEIQDSSGEEYGPVPSTLAVIQPRLRFYTLPSGPVKPYATAGMMMRFYDAYNDPQLSGEVSYPTRDGGVGLGITVGGGLAFDAPKGAIGFIEVPWTYLLTPEPFKLTTGEVTGVPRAELASGQVLAFRAGIGFRLF